MTDIRFIVKQYIDAGWSVVPLLPNEKKANSSWQRKGYDVFDFNPDSNVAGKCGAPSQDRVDIDCDALEAVAAAALLLPVTRTHGRTTKPQSHYWYVIPNIKTTQFTDVKNAKGETAMLIEIRSTGAYTVLPPSVHPSGDVLAWEDESVGFLSLTEQDAYAHARNVAIAALVARHYPDHGARHFSIGQFLPGFLLQAGLDELSVKHIIRAITTIAGDTDWTDRDNAISATITKFKNGENVTGGPKLAEALGDDVVAKMRAWLRMADADALEAFNARHFFVRMGKDSVIGREDDPNDIIFQTPYALRTEYANRTVQTGTDKDGSPKFEPLFDTWLKWPNRRSYRRVVFSPPPVQPDPQDFNLWRDYGVNHQKPIDPTLVLPFLEHVRHVICGDDPEYYLYAMNLFARLAQRPGEPGGVAMIMRGLQGAGKGVVATALGHIMGHYSHITKPEQATGRFNKAIGDKVVVFLDEAFWAGDKREQGALKALITEETVLVEPKGIDPFSVPNFAHIFAATNNDWSVPAGLDDRRFFALKVADTWAHSVCKAQGRTAERREYFARLWGSLRNGGYEALLSLLLRWDIGDFDVFDVPETPELRLQKLQSLSGAMRWLYDCVDSGVLFSGSWPASATNEEVYEAYSNWCGTGHKLAKIVFHRLVGRYLWSSRTNHKGSRGGKLRTVAELRQMLPALDDVDVERVDELWSSGKWTDAPYALYTAANGAFVVDPDLLGDKSKT